MGAGGEMDSLRENLVNNDPLTLRREAKEDWHQAERFFSEVTDPYLVDFAIFWERAARLRYLYLLRLLKRDGFQLSKEQLFQKAVR
jgi:hypothetical protein